MKGKGLDLLFIVVLASISTLLLLWIRGYTLPKIERYQEMRLKTTILEAAGIDYDKSFLDEVFHEEITAMIKNDVEFYLTPDSVYIFEFEGRGLWGLITGVITLYQDLETVKGINIISQEETPGLGSRITEEEYLSQFNGKKVASGQPLVLRKSVGEVNAIDAISGATISSQATIDIINQSVLKFSSAVGR